ncbi:hypothetical protein ACWDOP_15065 [Nocardia sp. NPDC003693]
MSDTIEVTVADTVRWLHDEGLTRLAEIGARAPSPVIAYTVDVETGIVTAFPAAVTGPGTDVLTLPADDLPHPAGTARRLLVVGVTATDAVLVLDLAVVRALGIHADRPELAARAWVVQLLLEPGITVTTNSADLAIATDARCRHTFIPGGGTLLTVDDKQPPVTIVSLNPAVGGSDRFDVAPDRSAELYLGERFWQLRRALAIDDLTWATLVDQLETPDPEPVAPASPGAGAQPEEQP